MRNALESGVERTKVKWLKNQLKEKRNKKLKNKYNKYKQEKKRVTYINEERRENSKVKEYEKLGEIKWWKVVCLADM